MYLPRPPEGDRTAETRERERIRHAHAIYFFALHQKPYCGCR